MIKTRVIWILVTLISAGAWRVWAAPPRIEVEALMTNTAVLQINGQRKMLRVGESFGGVTLVASYSRTATVEVDGERMVIGISRRIGTSFVEPEERIVKIPRNASLQYRTTAKINGKNVPVLVDTGANVVAMSSEHARTLGVDFSAGVPSMVETASGTIRGWTVSLGSVNVGGIRVDNVQTSVLEGAFPSTILLGMSYLKHVDIREKNGVLSLSRAW